MEQYIQCGDIAENPLYVKHPYLHSGRILLLYIQQYVSAR